MENDKIFEANPNLQEYHKTSDGQCFYTPEAAKAHANNLEDKSVEKVEREISSDLFEEEERLINEMDVAEPETIEPAQDAPAVMEAPVAPEGNEPAQDAPAATEVPEAATADAPAPAKAKAAATKTKKSTKTE